MVPNDQSSLYLRMLFLIFIIMIPVASLVTTNVLLSSLKHVNVSVIIVQSFARVSVHEVDSQLDVIINVSLFSY